MGDLIHPEQGVFLFQLIRLLIILTRQRQVPTSAVNPNQVPTSAVDP